MRSNKTAGPVPVLNGDQTIEDWKRILSKLTVGAAAETVVANYIYDPVCDYGTSVEVLRRVLQAWAEIKLNNRGTPHD
jgi:hypothetical protein